MGLGILEPNTNQHVAGTVLLDQQAAHSENVTTALKHGKGKNSHIILAPQPSEDPNDPLNWSQSKKLRVLAITFFGVIIHGVVPNPILNAGIVQISTELGRPVTDIALVSGYLLLATGAVGPFASAVARKYGKRPVYLFSSLAGVIGTAVGEASPNYNTLVAARVVQGIGVAAYEAISVATIGDIYFVHERGPMVATILFILSTISNFISIIAGVVTGNLGWHYNFHIMMPFAALQTVLFILFAPETVYRRSNIYDIDTQGSSEDLTKLARREARTAQHVENGDAERPLEKTTTTTTQTSVEIVPPKKTFFQEMAIYNGSFVDDSIFQMILACPAILFNLGALWQIVTTGILTAWYVAAAILTGVIFAGPPYLLDTASIGYTSVGPFVGGLLGCAVCFSTSTPLTKWMTRRNKGVYEPEFALAPVIPGALICVAGFVGFGYALQEGSSVNLVCFLWGVILFGVAISTTFGSSYGLNAFRNNSTELFIMNMVFKNFFFYGLTTYIIQWYTLGGPVQVFGTLAGITAFFAIGTTIPLYVFGKKYRHFWDHHNLLKILHLETDKTGAE